MNFRRVCISPVCASFDSLFCSPCWLSISLGAFSFLIALPYLRYIPPNPTGRCELMRHCRRWREVQVNDPHVESGRLPSSMLISPSCEMRKQKYIFGERHIGRQWGKVRICCLPCPRCFPFFPSFDAGFSFGKRSSGHVASRQRM